jgi:hypothetical protein
MALPNRVIPAGLLTLQEREKEFLSGTLMPEAQTRDRIKFLPLGTK